MRPRLTAVRSGDINLSGDGPDGIDDLELARRAVELRPELQIIYTTGGAPTDGMTALFVDGAAFLPKPYIRDELRKAIGSRSAGGTIYRVCIPTW